MTKEEAKRIAYKYAANFLDKPGTLLLLGHDRVEQRELWEAVLEVKAELQAKALSHVVIDDDDQTVTKEYRAIPKEAVAAFAKTDPANPICPDDD